MDSPDFAERYLALAEEANAAQERAWAEVERLVAAGDLERLRRLVARRRAAPLVELGRELAAAR